MRTDSLTGGFTAPSFQAAHVFRAAMDAMARPGRIVEIIGAKPPAPMSAAAGGLLLTLCDPGTPIFLAPSHDTETIRSWIAFHLGSPLTHPHEAVFALGTWESLAPVGRFSIGTSEYPDQSCTLIVEQPEFHASGVRLTGPGIETHAELSLPETEAFQVNASLFPLGFDCFFTSGLQAAALPRSTRVG
jgi:alpha-D-ribose 1-methylphosphonate 5-triphosphate synthase subunit PhnH